MNSRLQVIRRACADNDYKWPEQLTSGVMFCEGERITIEEFMEQVRLFKGCECK